MGRAVVAPIQAAQKLDADADACCNLRRQLSALQLALTISKLIIAKNTRTKIDLIEAIVTLLVQARKSTLRSARGKLHPFHNRKEKCG